MFTLIIETKNAAFYPPPEFSNKDIGLFNRVMANELDIIMNDITDKVREGHKSGHCFDSDHNIVGSWNLND